jgi:hypothetical protein
LVYRKSFVGSAEKVGGLNTLTFSHFRHVAFHCLFSSDNTELGLAR